MTENAKNFLAPPRLGEALRRGTIVTNRFSWFWRELPFMCVSTESNPGQNALISQNMINVAASKQDTSAVVRVQFF
jgi:hypothetical protein